MIPKKATQKIFKSLVKTSNLSGRKFRDKTDLAISAYARYNNGKTSMGIEKLYELAKKVNIKIDFNFKNNK